MKFFLPFLVAVLASFSVWAAPARMSWQDGVARLGQERHQAETCAAVIKARGSVAMIDNALMTYSGAKAEIDGIIAGLVVALAKDDEPGSLSSLNPRLERATAGRESLCRTAGSLLAPDPGAKGGELAAIVEGVVGSLIDAARALIIDSRERDAQTRKTIQNQIEAQAWAPFDAIVPARL